MGSRRDIRVSRWMSIPASPQWEANVSGILGTAMAIANQAAKHADSEVFKVAEAFDILCDTVEVFEGYHLHSATTRYHFVEAVNVALSSMPGNRISMRCIESADDDYAIEWLPYAGLPTAKTNSL